MSQIRTSDTWYFIGLEGKIGYAPVNENNEIMIPCHICKDKLRVFGSNCNHCITRNETLDV